MTFDFFNKAQDQNVLPFKFRLTVDSSRVLISTTQTFSTRHAHSVGVCVNVFVSTIAPLRVCTCRCPTASVPA